MENPASAGGASGFPAQERDAGYSTARDREKQHSNDELVDMLTGGLPDVAENRTLHKLARAIRKSLERQRQAARWARYCQGKLRRPTLTAAERARPVPPITGSPREALAAAWRAASPKDRQAFVAAVTRWAAKGMP